MVGLQMPADEAKRNRSRVLTVLKNMDEQIHWAREALKLLPLMREDDRRKCIMDIAQYGRNATFALQNLKGVDPRFQTWYAPHTAEMSKDPLLKYFNELRVGIVHKAASVETVVGTSIHSLSAGELPRMGIPPGARAIFGDREGKNYWEQVNNDGTITKRYFDMPADVGENYESLKSFPITHLGKPIKGRSVALVCGLYLAYLTELSRAAHEFFAQPPDAE